MATTEEVAKWLYRKLMNDGELSNRQAIHLVKERFGEPFLTVNERGNPALHPDVLQTFRRYIHGKADWDRDDLRWRKRPSARADDDDE